MSILVLLEVERAWVRARRPGPNFWLAVNKPQAQGKTSLISTRLNVGSISNFSIFISKKLRLEVLGLILGSHRIRQKLGLAFFWARSSELELENFARE